MSPESKKFTLEGAFSNSFPRTSLPPVSPRALLCLERVPEVQREGVGNLRATDFAPRLPLGPTEVEDRSSVCGS